MINLVKLTKHKSLLKALLCLSAAVGFLFAGTALATGGPSDLKDLVTTATGQFDELGKLMLAVCYLAGIGFSIAAIFKFKQYKDNPTQIPLGTPLTLLVIGVCLIFLPTLIKPIGQGLFGKDSKAGGFKGGNVTNLPGSDQ